MRRTRTGIQLAYPYELKRFKRFNLPAIAQPKLNGERCRVQLTPGCAPLFLSSTEEPIVSIPHLFEVFQVLSERVIQAPLELDGELYAHGMPLEDIHSIVSRKFESTIHENCEQVGFHCFDVVDETLPQIARTRLLNTLFKTILKGVPHVYHVDFMPVSSEDDVMQLLETYIRQGFEGIIVREPMATYVRCRSPFMLKFKPRQHDIYPIIRLVEAVSKYGEPKGMVGSILCGDSDGSVFEVSAGQLNHLERAVAWAERDDYIGGFCECLYQNKTSKRGVPYAAVCTLLHKNRDK